MKKFKYFLFLITSIFLLSCENENSKIEQENLSRKKIPSHIKSSNISKEEINSNPLLSSKLSFLENKKASMMNSREVYNTTYNFTTHTDKALHIQDTNSGYESYTFLITRDDASGSSNLENLQLSINPDGTTEAYIVSYNFTQEEYQNFTREDLYNSERILTKININSDELIEDKTVLIITDYGDYICVEEWYVGDYCCGPKGDLLLYSNCTYMYTGGGGGTAGDNDGTGGTGGTLSSGDDVNNGNGGGGTGGTGTIGDDYLGDSCRGCGWTAPVILDDEDARDDCNTSKEDLQKVFPNMPDANAELLASIINEKGIDFGITSDEDLWHFLAQAGHETGGFNTLNVTESTYWSTASRLANTYTKFTMDANLAATNDNIYYAPDYLQNSSGVANIAMCCKYGNGNVASGDGYKYRGRGLFQLTWKNNYLAFKTWYNLKYDPDIDPVTTPDIIATNDTLAILSGLWYYKTRVVDKIAIDSTTTVSKVTKPINPAKKGLTDRKQRFQKAKDSINCL